MIHYAVGMVLINEWLPNPAGADAKNEWIELYNNGANAQDLSDWHIGTKTGKPATLKGNIGPGEFLILRKGDFTFSLHNTNETLSLYDASGKLADQSSFFGTALEGKSFSRLRQGYGGQAKQGDQFMFASPTPGAQNNSAPALALIEESHPFGVPLTPAFGVAGFFETMVGVALVLAVATVIVIKKHASLSNTFFGRN